MRRIALAAALVLLAGGVSAQPGTSTWELNSDKSNITATMGGASARIGVAAGALEYNTAKPEQSTVAFSLDTSSIKEKPARDAFDTDHFPEMRISSSAAAKKGSNGSLALPMILTIREINKPVVFQVTLQKVGENVISLHAEATIRSGDFKMSGPGGNIQLVIDAPFNRVRS